jgi:uncharacterized Zn-finger protein
MNYLDFLIQDCLREYENVYIHSAIQLSTAQSNQSDNSIAVLLLLEQNLFSFESMETVTPVSLEEAPAEGPKKRFSCLECNLSYSGKTELKRHQLKHKPNKHGCSIMGCMKTFHRSDAMRVHAIAHERRVLEEEQKLLMNL